MLTIYFGDNEELNQAVKSRLSAYKLEYQEFASQDIDYEILLSFFRQMTDIFDLLTQKMLKFKLDNRMTMSQFIEKILNNVNDTMQLPIAITDKGLYPGLTTDNVGVFLPKTYRKEERIQLFGKLEELDAGRTFWKNFEIFRKQSELRWFEIYELLFADESDDLGEIKKAKDRFFSYKKNKQVPPDDIIEKILKIFLVDREDFFKKSSSDLQNF
ncbi:hypothetical protein [Streptococcus ferus]|uniref:hypothetical protein n=1 Tax=Streptococcus ferus TaxID=1345 RepID=UPI0035A031AA